MSTNKRVLVVAVMTEEQYEACAGKVAGVGFEDTKTAFAACLSTTRLLSDDRGFIDRVIRKARGE